MRQMRVGRPPPTFDLAGIIGAYLHDGADFQIGPRLTGSYDIAGLRGQCQVENFLFRGRQPLLSGDGSRGCQRLSWVDPVDKPLLLKGTVPLPQRT